MRVVAWPAYRTRDENPYNALLCDALRARGIDVIEYRQREPLPAAFDVLHIHWPDLVLRVPSARKAAKNLAHLLRLLSTVRRQGASVVWTAHNVRAHETLHPVLERLLWKALPHLIDGWISLSEAVAEELQSLRPAFAEVPWFIARHGTMSPAYGPAPDREAARRRLGIADSSRVLLLLGRFRRYKGGDRLASAFADLADPEALAVFAGIPDDPYIVGFLSDASARDPRIRLIMGRASDDSVLDLVSATDIVCVPTEPFRNSSLAMLALSYSRPILACRSPALDELRELVGDGWITSYEPPLSADDLRRALSEAAQGIGRPPRLEWAQWDRIAAETVAAYQSTRA
jgi:beta-1,4-mannosyltransferase